MVTTSISFFNGQITLNEAYCAIQGNIPCEIPRMVWLLENPESPLLFPGKINLYNHDCLHILLNRHFELADEAFVVGFTMGNDVYTRSWHIKLFKLIASRLYPEAYRFHLTHWSDFDQGVQCGHTTPVKNINHLNFRFYQNESVKELRRWLGLERLTLV